MRRDGRSHQRADVAAEIRGGDTEQAMETEQSIATSSKAQATFWRDRYLESRALGEFASIRGRYA